MATSNQMFDRLKEFLRHRYPDDFVNTQLLHGHAVLSEALDRLPDLSVYQNIHTEDTVDVLMKMANGFSVSIHMDYIQRTPWRTCKVVGEEGTIVWDINQGDVRLFTAREAAWRDFPEPKGYDINRMYVDEMRHFLCCLRGEAESSLPVAEAKKVLEIALAVKESMRSGEPKNIAPPVGASQSGRPGVTA